MSDESTESPPPAMSHVIIYTDGAAEPNPGPGGYGVVLLAGKHRKELSGGFRKTTNNRMELLAVIVGLESLTKPCLVTVYSDSKYVVESVERGSVKRWSQNNWFRTKTEKAKNADLWARFLVVYEKHKVRFKWVKGHAGVPENERCDELAVAGAQSYDSQPDEGYLADCPAEERSMLNNVQSTPLAPKRPDPSVGNVSHKEEGEACRKCGTPIIKKQTKPKPPKPGQAYYFEWYLLCPGCKTMYMVDEAKRML